MSDIAIKVEGLGKRYKIGRLQKRHDTLRDRIADSALRPFRALISHQERNGRNGNSQSEIRNSQSDDTLWALRDVSFDVRRGEVVGVIGRNGAGKSTLLKILSRITEPTEGYADINGRVASLLEVGTGFHPELTGRENIYLNGSILGMTREEIRKKFDEIVAFAEIEKFIDTPVKRYSSGMYVRLAFAVAAHLEPEILLVDEVLSVGDVAFQKKCVGKMEDVARRGRTVLFVSHNMGAVRQLCQSGILLEEGSIKCIGSISECLTEYMSETSSAPGLITDHIKYLHPSLHVETITINDSPADHLYVSASTDSLAIKVSGYLSEAKQLDIEAGISDLYDNSLAFFSPAHERGFANRFSKGQFHVDANIELPPRMISGDFYLNLAIAHSGVENWVDIPRAIKLEIEGITLKTGVRFNYYKGIGWLLLASAANGAGEESEDLS